MADRLLSDAADLDRRSFLGALGGVIAGTVFTGSAPTMASAAPLDTMPRRSAAPILPPDIVMMDATSLSRAIHTRQVSCLEVMRAHLDHIDKVNPKVNAIVALQDRETLLVQAREHDTQLSRGKSMGPLHGFPHAVKDLEKVKGIRTTFGSPLLKNFVPSEDSIMVARLRQAGAIFVGKTNVPEWGFGSHTYNPVYGTTCNAFDQSRSAGGSSGGAAVALALRMVPLADGSDCAGSLRNPAGWNNVFGFRTSYGRVPTSYEEVWEPNLTVLGPMARTVADLAMLLSVQAGYDSRAPLSIEEPGSRFSRNLKKDFKGKRIAWLGDFNGQIPFEPGVLDVCKGALKAFETIGCSVEEAHPDYPLDPLWRATVLLRGWQECGGLLLRFYKDPSQRALLKPETVFEIETALHASAYDISAAALVRSQWYAAVRLMFERYDYLALPTAQVFPFDVDLHWPQEVAGVKMETYHEWMKAQMLISMSSCPSLAVPAGFSPQGQPMGIQIVGPQHQEFACLQLAYAYEQATQATCSHLPSLIG